VTLVNRPSQGRVFETTRRVRVADADPTGRLRLDAVARFVQDVGYDDVAAAGHDTEAPWVVRRTEVEIDGWPQYGEQLAVTTWCGGTGSRWAERRVSFRSGSGVVDSATLVVHLDAEGRPVRLPGWFHETYASAAEGRVVSPKLTIPAPPPDATARPWPARFTDLDVMGHVNNAVPWAVVEDECARRRLLPTRVVAEWSGAIDRGDEVQVVAAGSCVWLTVAGAVRVAVALTA
jgi:acyl-ACP thioesterase